MNLQLMPYGGFIITEENLKSEFAGFQKNMTGLQDERN